MIASMALEYTHGKMVDNMKVIGTTVSSMGKVYIDRHLVRRGEEDGLRESVLSGLMRETIKMLEAYTKLKQTTFLIYSLHLLSIFSN